MAYRVTAEDALAQVQALALRVLADRLERGEGPRGPVTARFETFARIARHTGLEPGDL